MRNLHATVNAKQQSVVTAGVRAIFAHTEPAEVGAQWDRVADSFDNPFPNPAAFLRLATAVVIDAHDEWQVTRRYLSDVSMDELRTVIATKKAAETLDDQPQIA